MVALKEMMPIDPAERDFVEATLCRHPSVSRFANRLQQHVQDHFQQPVINLDALAHDEWDPPLAIEVTADIPEDEYVSRLHELRRWAHLDPDYDPALMQIILLRRPVAGIGKR